jgi:hypothetical protein
VAPPRKTGPWYGRDLDVLRFDHSARSFPGLTIERGRRGGRFYRVRMAVPYYESRLVEIRFTDWARAPKVFVDGPRASPHRYSDGSLCMWYPKDPPDQKWVFDDGLLTLLNYIQAHLFREAWWREKGPPWLGPEAPHRRPKESVPEADERDRDSDLRGRAAGR